MKKETVKPEDREEVKAYLRAYRRANGKDIDLVFKPRQRVIIGSRYGFGTKRFISQLPVLTETLMKRNEYKAPSNMGKIESAYRESMAVLAPSLAIIRKIDQWSDEDKRKYKDAYDRSDWDVVYAMTNDVTSYASALTANNIRSGIFEVVCEQLEKGEKK